MLRRSILFSYYLYVFQVPTHTTPSNIEQETDEVRELRENFALLTFQYGQLNEANRAWQEFHQTQLDNFRSKVQDCIQTDVDVSFDQIAQQIVDQITKEREDFAVKYQILEKANTDLQSGTLYY